MTLRHRLLKSCLVCGGTASERGLKKGKWVYRRCRTCGLLWSDPIPTGEEITEHYSGKFERGNYELVRRYASEYRLVHRQLADWINPRPGDRVLDIGTFTGELLDILATRGADVHGAELQPEAVRIANERLGGRVHQVDVHDFEFGQGTYDIVSMMGLIEHVSDPRRMVRRAAELLRGGGRIYIETPNAGSAPARLLRSAWPPLAPIEHIHLFSARALEILLKQERFVDVVVRRHVKRLPFSYVHEQFANFGGRGWQRATAPLRAVLGDTRLPLYAGEMLVCARRA